MKGKKDTYLNEYTFYTEGMDELAALPPEGRG